MKRLILIFIFPALLAACAGPPRWEWRHPQRTEAELAADKEECRRYAAQTIADPFVMPPLGQDYWEEKNDLFYDCMVALGYHLEDVEPEEEK